MNVQLEPKPHCILNIHFELSKEEVDAKRKSISSEFLKYARLPGFRPGKAPAKIVEQRFADQIAQELEKRLIPDSIDKAVLEHKLKVLRVSEVNHVKFPEDGTLTFSATAIIRPEFDLPEYKGLTVELNKKEVEEKEIDDLIDYLRKQQASYADLERKDLQWDDFAVIDYEIKVDGVPVREKYPNFSERLAENKNFWILVKKDVFLPGFCDALIGIKVDETRTFDLTLADDYEVEEMRGVKLTCEVLLRELKQENLPELDDAFAEKTYIAKTLEELRTKLRENFVAQYEREFEQKKREKVTQKLLGSIDFEVPAQYVREEADALLHDFVERTGKDGVSDEQLRQHEKEIVASAQETAKGKIKGNFVFLRIAEEEKLKVEEAELIQRVQEIANHQKMSFEKVVKKMRQNNTLSLLSEHILSSKALDLVVAGATVIPEKEAPAVAETAKSA